MPPARRIACRSSSKRRLSYLDLDWQDYVVQDPRFYRPAEVDLLVGDASKAGEQLGWEPTVDFRQLVRLMVDADMEALQKGDGDFPAQADEVHGP